LPIDENIRLTAAFVKQHGRELLIEGAADEIRESGGAAGELTSPELAERYHRETGVDLMVANLGTEHRATTATLQYHGELAREITMRIGAKLCLHGTSSVPAAQVKQLFADGVRRVNLWTTLERDSTPVLLKAMQANVDKLAGPKAQLSHYTNLWRQDIIFTEMKRIVRSYLDLWYV
jgi:fructose/tagatose bisphosphate aldolase